MLHAAGRARVGALQGSRQRHLLLQELFHALDARVSMHAPHHDILFEVVGHRQQNHALVMRHIFAHQRLFFAHIQPLAGKIDGFIEPIQSARAVLGQVEHVTVDGLRIIPDCHHRSIRRDDQIVGQAALKTQSWNAKGAVLVRLVNIQTVEARF